MIPQYKTYKHRIQLCRVFMAVFIFVFGTMELLGCGGNAVSTDFPMETPQQAGDSAIVLPGTCDSGSRPGVDLCIDSFTWTLNSPKPGEVLRLRLALRVRNRGQDFASGPIYVEIFQKQVTDPNDPNNFNVDLFTTTVRQCGQTLYTDLAPNELSSEVACEGDHLYGGIKITSVPAFYIVNAKIDPYSAIAESDRLNNQFKSPQLIRVQADPTAASTPLIKPQTSAFINSITVTLTNEATSSDADIFYTTDGTNPTDSSTAILYNAAIPLVFSQTTTLKAIAKKIGKYLTSTVATAVFTKTDLPQGSALAFAKDKIAFKKISVSSHAAGPETYAATILQAYLKEITGATFDITDEFTTKDVVVIGRPSSHPLIKNLSTDFNKLGEDGFIIKTVDNNLYLAGNGLRAPIYAVYALLEALGCRFFFPYRGDMAVKSGNAEDLVIPTIPDLKAGPFDTASIPAFSTRIPNLDGLKYTSNPQDVKGYADWHLALGMNGMVFQPQASSQKEVYDIRGLPSKAEDHNLFPDLARVCPFNNDQGLTARLENIYKIADEYLNKNPSIGILGLYLSDGATSDNCGNGSSYVTNYITTMVYLANHLSQTHPSVQLEALVHYDGIWFSGDLQKSLIKTFNPNGTAFDWPKNLVFLWAERSFPYPYSLAALPSQYVNRTYDLMAWLGTKQPVVYFPYYSDSVLNGVGYPMYHDMIHDDAVYLRDNRVSGYYYLVVDGEWYWSSINMYFAAKLSWDPTRTAKEIFDDFMKYYYGEDQPGDMTKFWTTYNASMQNWTIFLAETTQNYEFDGMAWLKDSDFYYWYNKMQELRAAVDSAKTKAINKPQGAMLERRMEKAGYMVDYLQARTRAAHYRWRGLQKDATGRYTQSGCLRKAKTEEEYAMHNDHGMAHGISYHSAEIYFYDWLKPYLDQKINALQADPESTCAQLYNN